MSRTLLITAILAAAPSLALAAPQTIAVMDVAPESFVATAASSNAFEIRSSELAAQKATQPALKAFATQMIADHKAAAEGLKAAAAGLSVPEALAPKHAAMIGLLEGADGAAFDMIYTDMQAGAHAEAVTLFSAFSAHGSEPALKAFAAKTLPTLETHKMHIDQIVAVE